MSNKDQNLTDATVSLSSSETPISNIVPMAPNPSLPEQLPGKSKYFIERWIESHTDCAD